MAGWMKRLKIAILLLAVAAGGCEMLVAEQLYIRGAGWGSENLKAADSGHQKEVLCK